jgi:hypothetical protein
MQQNGSNTVTIVLICIIVILGGYIWISKPNTDYSKYERKIDSLSVVVSLLELDQVKKDSLLTTYKQELDSLNIEKKATEKEINDIRQFYGKAIRDIGKLSVAQLDSFFTARYNSTRLQHSKGDSN